MRSSPARQGMYVCLVFVACLVVDMDGDVWMMMFVDQRDCTQAQNI